jgi:hypothetical protein
VCFNLAERETRAPWVERHDRFGESRPATTAEAVNIAAMAPLTFTMFHSLGH